MQSVVRLDAQEALTDEPRAEQHESRSVGQRLRAEWPVLAVALVITVVHVLLSFRVRSPITFGDEGGYLGNATQLARGEGRPLEGYVAGYSLLLVPAASLPISATAYYTAVLITNSLLAGISALLAAALGRACMPKLTPGRSAVVALAVVLEPYVFFMAGTAMSENALVPATLAGTLLLVLYARDGRMVAGVGAALASAYTFWVTPRGIVVVGAFVLTLLGLAARRVVRVREALILTVVAGATMFAGHLFNDAVRDGAKVPGVGERLTRVPPLGSVREWEKLIAGTAGRFAYLGVATAGLALVGLVIAARWAVKLPRAEPRSAGTARDDAARFAAGFYTVVVVVGTTILAAATFTGRGLPRIDHLYYGRYVEGIGMAVVVIGVAWIATNLDHIRRRSWAFVIVACGIALVALTSLARLYPNRPSVAVINVSNIVTVIPLRELLDDRGGITSALLLGAAIVVVVLAVGFFRFRAWAVVTTVALAAASFGVLDLYHLPGADARADQRVLDGTVHALDRAGVSTDCVLYGDQVSEWHIRNYVYLLPESRFVNAPSPRAAACGPLAFVGNGPPTTPGNWHLVARENHYATSLWIDLDRMSPEDARRVVDEGFAYDKPVCAVMPRAAYRSRITGGVTGVPDTGIDRGTRLDVQVLHSDGGSPWLGANASSPAGACGKISLIASVLDRDGATLYKRMYPLSESLVPGQRIDVSGSLLRRADPDDARLRAADRVRLELTQTEVTDFVAQGDRATELPLRP